MSRLAALALAPAFAPVFALAMLACDPGEPAVDSGPRDAGPPDAARGYVPEPFSATEATAAYCGVSLEESEAIEARITEWLSLLQIREKVALLHGDTILPEGGTWEVPGHEALGIPGLHMLDGPRGLSRFSNKAGTAFPVAMMRGATWDPALERRVGAAMGVELRSAGADVLLAPCLNILRHPRWGRAQETYSEDVHHLGEMGVAFIEGVQSEGVLANAKHYAANSIEDTRHEVSVAIDERTLREIYLPHFRRAVQEARVGSVMSAYNRINGEYADLSTHLLREILKDEWGFEGFVVSDWFLGTHGSADSLRAGLDIEMPTGSNFRDLRAEVEGGVLPEAELDRALRRVLRAQLCFGLDARERVLDDPSQRETEAHRALAREVAARGAVLLRDEPPGGVGAPLLPLDRAATSRVVLLGPLADLENIGDTGSSEVRPSEILTLLEGLTSVAGAGVAIEHLPGDAVAPGDEARIASADAVILALGLTAEDEGEGEIGAGDREGLALPEAQLALLRQVAALSPRTIVILEGGAAITTAGWEAEVAALLFAFYPGQEGGAALAELIFGDRAPTGRLPFSVPAREEDLPVFDNTSSEVSYGYFHGYRHLEREGLAPAHAFGFGLTYTRFEYLSVTLASPTVSPEGRVEVRVAIRNAGTRAGTETVQLYASAIGSRVARAPRDLRAFGQITLDPGAMGELTLSFPARDLAFYDVDAGAWEVERIEHELSVGASAADLRLTERVRVE